MIDEKTENKKGKYVKIFMISAIVVILIPIILGWIIPKKSFIPGFTNDNDWIGFFGSYMGAILGGVVTLITLALTRKDTRKIQVENAQTQTDNIKLQKKNIELQEKLIDLQSRIVNIEEENQLKSSRTIYSESSVKDYLTLNSNRAFFKGDYILKSEYYKKIEEVIEKKEKYAKGDYIISKPAIEWLEKLRRIDTLNYKIIKNIGGNNMYRINIKLIGEWYMHDDTKIEDELNFCVDCIENGRSVLIPLFKLDEGENNIVQFGISEMQVIYETGMLNKRERITVDTRYKTNSKEINSKVNINKVENYEAMDFNFDEYLVIR